MEYGGKMSKLILDYYKHAISTEHGADAEWDRYLARRKKSYIDNWVFQYLNCTPKSGHQF